jgi:hypothetical protein
MAMFPPCCIARVALCGVGHEEGKLIYNATDDEATGTHHAVTHEGEGVDAVALSDEVVKIADHGVVGMVRVVRAAPVVAQIDQQRVDVACSCARAYTTHHGETTSGAKRVKQCIRVIFLATERQLMPAPNSPCTIACSTRTTAHAPPAQVVSK